MENNIKNLRSILVFIVFLLQAWWLTTLLVVNFADKIDFLFSISQYNLKGRSFDEVSTRLGNPDSIVSITTIYGQEDNPETRWIYVLGISSPLNELIIDFHFGQVSQVSYSMIPVSTTKGIQPFVLFSILAILICFLFAQPSARISSLIKSVLLSQVELIASPFPLYPFLLIITIVLSAVSGYYFITAIFASNGTGRVLKSSQ